MLRESEPFLAETLNEDIVLWMAHAPADDSMVFKPYYTNNAVDIGHDERKRGIKFISEKLV